MKIPSAINLSPERRGINGAAFQDALLRYGFAVLCTGVATYIRVALTPYIDERLPFGFYFLSVILVAGFAGSGPAIVSLLTSAVAAGHFVVPPEGSFLITDARDQISLAIFFVVGGISIFLFHRLESERGSAQRQAATNETLNRQLIESDRRKDDFLALLSHELRCPLAPLGYAVDLLPKISQDPEQVNQTAKIFSRNLKHLVRLVDDLLDLSRFSRDNLQLQRSEMDYLDCVKSAIEMVRMATVEKQHEFFVQLPEEKIMVDADPVRCCQVVCNLLLNAVKYTPNQGRIQLSVVLDDSGITTSVEDNGIGLSESIQQRVFEPFFQLHSKRSRFSAGMGLGLAISRKLAELHAGRIDVVSEGMGQGCKFSFFLPASVLRPNATLPTDKDVTEVQDNGNQSDRIRPTEQSGARLTSTASIGSQAQRVLIIDDDRDTADSLSFLLSLEGFHVATAYDGIMALNDFHQFQPQMIVLDIGLPGMDGYEITRRLRAQPHGESVTIVAVSGWGSAQDRELGKSAGFDAHLVKPITLSELLPLLVQRASSLVDP